MYYHARKVNQIIIALLTDIEQLHSKEKVIILLLYLHDN
jgi:hypothetical protein